MLGWLFFIASCYIVTFIAKCIYKGINTMIKSLFKALGKLRHVPEEISKGEEANVC